ncbi:CLUMA_CG015941, isoform A [Clunio marinus]|uniref:CLUMA_CG015941, isoform A n=1 Tax=Clunio marinus TaxID=568069 RepID=A0A1J1IRT2_9DIPT|nr:CLUMA_CG015941, isoform A [Clunio marinus]
MKRVFILRQLCKIDNSKVAFSVQMIPKKKNIINWKLACLMTQNPRSSALQIIGDFALLLVSFIAYKRVHEIYPSIKCFVMQYRAIRKVDVDEWFIKLHDFTSSNIYKSSPYILHMRLPRNDILKA